MENGRSDDAPRPDDADRGRPVGARFHARPPAGREPAGREPRRERAGSPFPVVLRGYDRGRVDDRLTELAGELAALRAEVEDWRQRWCAAREHAADLEAELRDRPADARPAAGAGAAAIADKVLRLARMEAAQIRAEARRDAEALLAQARRPAS